MTDPLPNRKTYPVVVTKISHLHQAQLDGTIYCAILFILRLIAIVTMKLNFQIDRATAQKYFTYIILKSSTDSGDLDDSTLKNSYGLGEFLSKKNYETIKKLSHLIHKNKVDFKEKNIIENFSDSLANKPLKNWDKLEEELSDIFSNIFHNEEFLLQKQREHLERSTSILLLSSIQKIFGTTLEEVDVYLTPGGFPKFTPGLALNLQTSISNGLKPTVFIASSNTHQENYRLLESTVIHEVSHLIENSSECFEIAKSNIMLSSILKHKPKSNSPRHFVFESIITAIAGNKHSYHIQKYYTDYYTPYILPLEPNINDTYLKIASLILPVITPYIDDKVILDKGFFENITNLIL